jgi:hypothetical protein
MTDIIREIEVAQPIIRQESVGPPIIVYARGGSGGAQFAAQLDIGTPIPDLPGVADVRSAIIELAKDIPVSKSFTQQDLSVAGILPYVHGRDTTTPSVEIWNDYGVFIYPDKVSIVNPNEVGIVLKSFEPISGSWRVKITRG